MKKLFFLHLLFFVKELRGIENQRFSRPSKRSLVRFIGYLCRIICSTFFLLLFMKEITLSSFYSLFVYSGTILCVRFCDFWAVEYSRAWDSVISGRWSLPARGILRFLSGGTLPRVRFRDF